MDQRVAVLLRQLPSGVALILVQGLVDTISAPLLDERLRAAIRECGVQPPIVRLDLSEVAYLDRDGLDVLLQISHDLTAAAGSLELHHPSAAVVRMLHEAHLDGASWTSMPD